jgi:2-polyprenyl-3-methyl-5-hydroxy-6-metoxy-1,4-benzoquinol methylase
MNLKEIAKNIEKGEDGIYYSKTSSKISYPETGNEDCMQIEDQSFWFSHRNKIIISVVSSISKSKVFFDIGGGNGFVAQGLQENGVETVLVEPGIMGGQNAKKRGINNIICSTLEDANFKENSLSSVGLFDVVEHIENDVQFLQNIYKYIEDDGYVYITVPAYKFLWSDNDDQAGHFRRYTLKSIENKLKSIGFSIEYSTYFFSILPLPILIFRTIPSLLGVKRKTKKVNGQNKDHNPKKGILNAVINKILNFELSRIRKMKRISLGGSCLIVGKKKARF